MEKQIISPALPLNGVALILTGLIDAVRFQLVTEPEPWHRRSIWQTLEKRRFK